MLLNLLKLHSPHFSSNYLHAETYLHVPFETAFSICFFCLFSLPRQSETAKVCANGRERDTFSSLLIEQAGKRKRGEGGRSQGFLSLPIVSLLSMALGDNGEGGD